jgi:hypothetical protein
LRGIVCDVNTILLVAERTQAVAVDPSLLERTTSVSGLVAGLLVLAVMAALPWLELPGPPRTPFDGPAATGPARPVARSASRRQSNRWGAGIPGRAQCRDREREGTE